MTVLAEIEAMLRQAIGLDAASVGSALIERAVRQRQAACELGDIRAYLQHLRHARRELQNLIEAVVVPETWFFRHRESYEALTQLVMPPYLQACATGLPPPLLRLLSLPCSSGEEPFSMAMALLDAGMAPEHFRIDAIDISRRALRSARGARYGRNSFRGEHLDYRERHLAPLGQEWQVGAAVRRQVRFRHGNLFQHRLEGPYDVVFCRNVLIYFDRDTQERAVVALLQLLAPQALLFVGPSETSLLHRPGFATVKLPLAFAFRRCEASAAPTPRPGARVPPLLPPAAWPPPRPAPAVRIPAGVPPRHEADGGEALLDRAAQLADSGNAAEAQRLCEQYRKAHSPNARLYYLLGLLQESGGASGEAAAHYRKALYLDPQHDASLNQLALLLEKQGDAGGARLLRERSRRLAPKQQRAP